MEKLRLYHKSKSNNSAGRVKQLTKNDLVFDYRKKVGIKAIIPVSHYAKYKKFPTYLNLNMFRVNEVGNNEADYE